LPAAKRVTQISIIVDKVCQKVYQDGLAYTLLNKLIDIITLPNRLEQGSLAALIRHLYPASKVPDSIVIKVVGNLGHGRGKLSLTSQGLLLKWLVMVYDVLENQKIMSQLYSVLFNLLDTVAIRYV
jgi:centromere protein I